ncbi:MAG: hypothetical protein A2600_02270 [Candidatus Lambdaproteobacteria bacterium RIFOXYD1_FULL_56_27]|uniref:Outer membrane lipoprotein BamD-like domain-containing protein n=1 Tax=Candidatus Lambdaproteobacteria bacterium RIFOXYD2_FULL_56_26 TaxID=1817773 RepID=A0A1F6H2I1_9PROT|nr:MAG: hypothetical protein A2426_09310 [Candidatus Lambdaproteobacteria bacterium RIFOXYC1_FULL_56_13]OGH04607.1 MAG: hypothetical protein A2557_06335 [Candidatus Lambdaproteobacteria bacterium RIFOXYD2_FULL_56_26]OGH09071.1 MAG: hypothetical protein A2600_02270 [Candidatus Lambdaproteobacteria bacterium RIFOXYD1_FULL_56_27]
MARTLIALTLGLVLLFPAPLWALKLEDRMEVLEKRLVDLERLGLEQKTELLDKTKELAKKAEAQQKSNKEFYKALDQLKEDFAQVNRGAEQDDLAARKLQAKLEELEQKLNAQGVELFELKELIKAQTQAQEASATQAQVAKSEAVFEQGLQDFKDKKYAAAQEGLLDFAKKSPNQPLAPEALYYGAFSAFLLKDYKTANPAFDDLIRLYPESPRLLTARWQLALGLLAAKDPGAAKAQLAILAKQTTDPKLAEKAKKKLKTLKK